MRGLRRDKTCMTRGFNSWGSSTILLPGILRRGFANEVQEFVAVEKEMAFSATASTGRPGR
jgi:hypothetical protein